MVAVDTGGEAGTTDKAYDWYRDCRRKNLHGNIMLIKGGSRNAVQASGAPFVKMSWVGARAKGDHADIPLHILNKLKLNDIIVNAIKRSTPGPGYMHFPKWLNSNHFEQLKAEIRLPDGTYLKRKKRNEAFDLSAYITAACFLLGVEKIDWRSPPKWAAPLSENCDVIMSEERRRLQASTSTPRQLPQSLRRRVTSSSYLR
jgi:phage terminase large subunit GpA-like protein